MNKFILNIIILFFFSGCAGIPFQDTVYVTMDDVEPKKVIEKFKFNSPENYSLINSIVFEYNWNKLSAIGYSDINTIDKTFRIVCMNPMGVKLFELSGNKDATDSHFVLEQFTQRGNFKETIGEDIRRIYFDLMPSPEANVEKQKYKFVFSEPYGNGVMKYVFAGAGGFLTEKKYHEDGIVIWRVSYYEYRQINGKFYPSGIILKNYKYGYTLTVKLKEIMD